jgi:Fic family protein
MSLENKLQEIESIAAKIEAAGKFSPEVLKNINYRFRLDWNYYSNRMEGGTLTPQETRSVMVGNVDIQGKPLKDILEMTGHDKVVLEILKIGKGELRLSEKRIKEIHRGIMSEDDPKRALEIGKWKSEPNEIINYRDEKISFTPPSEVPEAIHKLLDSTNANLDGFFRGENFLHPVKIAAKFHIEYISIHPFYDGNGRTARILNNLLLISCGLPPIIIKDQHKQLYYQLLGDIQAYGGSTELFYEFIADRVLESEKLVWDAIEGKDIREPDDFDKELKQIEIKLRNAQAEVVKRSQELVRSIFQKSIKPLSDALYEKLSKINRFFAEFTLHVQTDERNIQGIKSTIDPALEDYFNSENVRNISISYQWGGFNMSGANTFWLSANLTIQLNQFDYTINEQQTPEYNHGLKKLYTQQLTEIEIENIVTAISTKALNDMKRSYKQVTGKDL